MIRCPEKLASVPLDRCSKLSVVNLSVACERLPVHRGSEMKTKDTVAWKVKTFAEEEGAIPNDRITQLSAKFDLGTEHLDGLSVGLTIALHPDRYLGREEIKSLQRERAQRAIEDAVTDLGAATKKLSRVSDRINAISFKPMFSYLELPKPEAAHLQNLERCIADIANLKKFLLTMSRGNAVSSKNVPDKRFLRDERRRIVCKFIFESWEESGRVLSYTTDPLTSDRGGPLLEFVNAVVECITDPPGQLGGEAIKTELEAFKNLRAERDAKL